MLVGRKYSEDESKAFWLTTLALTVQALGIGICTFIYLAFIGTWCINHFDAPLTWVLFYSLMGGIVTWALVLFATPMYGWWFITIKPNFGMVLGTLINKDRVDTRIVAGVDQRTQMADLRSLRELGSGWHGKLPWEVPAGGVDLRAEILIGNGEKNPLLLYDLTNIQWALVWQCTLTPLRGSLENYIRRQPDTIIEFFRGEFEQYLISWFKKQTQATLFDLTGASKALDESLKDLFSGPNIVDKREHDQGMVSSQIQFKSMTRNKEYQAVIQRQQEAKDAADTLKTIRDALGSELEKKVDPNLLLLAAGLSIPGDAKPLLILGGHGVDAKTILAATQGGKDKGGSK